MIPNGTKGVDKPGTPTLSWKCTILLKEKFSNICQNKYCINLEIPLLKIHTVQKSTLQRYMQDAFCSTVNNSKKICK